MNKFTYLFALLAFVTFANAQITNSRYNHLVWSEEFSGNALNRSNWQYEDHCRPANDELQCYTPRTNNVYVRDGNLHIKAIPETWGNKRFTSGRINTRHAHAWRYGRFEVRAKLPRGDYLWPAFWMLPRDYVYGGWAASGEIDIMEYRGQKTRQISNALHYGGEWPNNAHVGSGPLDFNFDFSEGYHIFTLVWERDQMRWYVDNRQIASRSLTRNWYSGRGRNPYTDIRQPFDQPFFFLINMATGGNFFGAESQRLTTAIGQNWPNPILMVDYVRVYQEGPVNPNPVPVPSQNAPSTTTQNRPSTSIGASSAVSSAASSAVSSAASSAVSSAETIGRSTYVITEKETPQTTAKYPTPAPTRGGEDDQDTACVGRCGSGTTCCNDQKLGAVCYDPSNFVCETDSRTSQKSLCGKGLGVCNTVCFDKQMYVCGDGGIRLK